MLNPDRAFSSGSYTDVRKRILVRLCSAGVNDKVLRVLQSAYEDALAVENLVLSRVERKRLLVHVLKSQLKELGQQLDKG